MVYTINDFNLFPKETGIYKIYFTNSNSDKIYIGSASGKNGFYNRWKSHISALRNNKSKSIVLQTATNKYKIDNMIFEIVEKCSSELCLIREQFYIDKYDTYKNGYNGRPISSNNGGKPMNENTKSKISKKWKLMRDTYSTDVIKLYINEGKTTREICKILNISRNFLSKILKENNIQIRRESGLKKRKIYQYKDGNLLYEWESVNDCLRKQSFNNNGIRLVLMGKCIHYKGFYFSYEKLSEKEVIEREIDFKVKSKSRKYYFIS